MSFYLTLPSDLLLIYFIARYLVICWRILLTYFYFFPYFVTFLLLLFFGLIVTKSFSFLEIWWNAVCSICYIFHHPDIQNRLNLSDQNKLCYTGTAIAFKPRPICELFYASLFEIKLDKLIKAPSTCIQIFWNSQLSPSECGSKSGYF